MRRPAGLVWAVMVMFIGLTDPLANPSVYPSHPPVPRASATHPHTRRGAVRSDTDAPTAPGGSSHTTTVVVEPGPLTVEHAPSTVTLTRIPGTNRFQGTVRNLRAVDARGSGAGWDLGVTVTRVDASRAHQLRSNTAQVATRAVRVVAVGDSTAGMHPRPGATADLGRRITLVRAASGTGMGTFAVTTTLDVTCDGVAEQQISASVAFDLD